jgi:hypothetical protein
VAKLIEFHSTVIGSGETITAEEEYYSMPIPVVQGGKESAI